MRWFLAAMIITGCLANNTWGDTGQPSQSNQSSEICDCPMPRTQALAMAVTSFGLPVQSLLEAVSSILKPFDSVAKLVDSFPRAITSGNAEEVERLTKAINGLTKSTGEIPDKIQMAGISLVAGPYWCGKCMFITLVGCPNGG